MLRVGGDLIQNNASILVMKTTFVKFRGLLAKILKILASEKTIILRFRLFTILTS